MKRENPSQLSLEAHQRIFEGEIAPELFAGAAPVARPVAVIFGGQPGAGKSALVDAAVQEFTRRGGCVPIVGDELRAYHPRYWTLLRVDDKTAALSTDHDTGQWVEKAIAHAQTRRFNIVVEGTMRDQEKVAATMTGLRAAGYEIDARALAVNERLSWQGVLQRYENQKLDRGTGRMTTERAHRAGYEGLPVSLERIEREGLADRLTLYRRGGVPIYANQAKNGEWMNAPTGRDALEGERARPLTLDELREHATGFDRLAMLLARPERQATDAEIGHVERLRREARDELAATAERAEQSQVKATIGNQSVLVATHESEPAAGNAGHTYEDAMTKKRLVVMNGQKIIQSERAPGDWQVEKVEKAHGIKPGYYNLHSAVTADKKSSYVGPVVHADQDFLYQQNGVGLVRHTRDSFDILPEIGAHITIGYSQGRANMQATSPKKARSVAH